MLSERSIPVTIIAGFLGAGKTSLLNHILHGQHSKRIAVLVNDFGSINIDAELVVDVEEDLISLANGCICCSIRNDLQLTLVRLARLPNPPEHIVIETSGVSDPAAVAQVFYDPDLWRVVNLDAIVTLVDAEQTAVLTKDLAQLAETQVKAADLLVLNKVDLVDADQLQNARAWLQKIRPGAPVFEVTHGCVPLEVLFSPEITLPRPKPANLNPHLHEVNAENDHDHAHALVFDTWSYSQATPLRMAQLQTVINSLPTSIYRVKGFLYLADQPASKIVLQMVGRRVAVSDGGAWVDEPQTRLVFISQHETVNYSAIEIALNRCRIESNV